MIPSSHNQRSMSAETQCRKPQHRFLFPGFSKNAMRNWAKRPKKVNSLALIQYIPHLHVILWILSISWQTHTT